jgi:putative RNA 2'-phosphotransferase
VDAKKMSDDGFDFFISVNGVWLTKTVPVEYLKSEK